MITRLERKQMKIFFIVLIITTFILGLSLRWAYILKDNMTITNLVAVQMLIPANAVMIAELKTEKHEDILFIFNFLFIIFTIFSYIILMLGLLFQNEIFNMIFGISSAIFHLLLITIYFKESILVREERLYTFTNSRKSIFFIILFVFLFALRSFMAFFFNRDEFFNMINNINILLFLILFLNYFFSFYFFFGEELGWRYFLQPKLQKIFGKRIGVIILGIIWGLWHIFISLYYYSPDTFLYQVFIQVFFCIAMSIFMGMCYMETENIWLCVIIHYLNNNLAGIVSGGEIANKVISLNDTIDAIIINLIFFGIFIFAKSYRKVKKV